MQLGNLATIVANKPQPWKTRSELLEQFENSLKKGREVLQKTTDDRLLNTKWRTLYAGKLMMEQTRYEAKAQ
jgi:hypothetical protein